MKYMDRVVAGEVLLIQRNDTTDGDDYSYIKLVKDYHGEGDDAVVIEAINGWVADYCYTGFQEAVCDPGSDYLDTQFLVGFNVLEQGTPAWNNAMKVVRQYA